MKAHEKEFIDAFAPLVMQKCKEHGWGVPSAIIGQALLESMKSKGLSGLAESCHNYYGMKWVNGCGCDYKAYTTAEQNSNGSYYVIAKFRKYPTMAEGVEGYFRFIESYKRYKPVMASKNYTEYATQLKLCGWATSILYTQNIIAKVKNYNLAQYDNITIIPKQNISLEDLAQEVIDGLWGSGTTRRFRLEQAGYNYQEVQNKVNEMLKS